MTNNKSFLFNTKKFFLRLFKNILKEVIRSEVTPAIQKVLQNVSHIKAEHIEKIIIEQIEKI